MGFLEIELYMWTRVSTNQANDQKDLKKCEHVVEHFKNQLLNLDIQTSTLEQTQEVDVV